MRFLLRLISSLGLLVGLITVASAQHVISVRAGLINHADRKASVKHQNGKVEEVATGFQLENGDELEAKGRIEILLNPGSVLRLEQGSLLKVVETRFTEMRFDLKFGVALVEANRDMGREDEVALVIGTPQATVKVEKEGLYRIAALPSGGAVVAVRKGKAQVLTAAGAKETVKKGRRLIVDNGTVAQAKLEKDLDGFERWGEQRAEALAVLNYRLSRPRSWPVDQLSSWNYSGFWYYDPFQRSHCYLPFSARYRSPYGFYHWNYFDPYGWGSPYWWRRGTYAGGGGYSGRPGNNGGNNTGGNTNPGGGTVTTPPPAEQPNPDVRRKPPSSVGFDPEHPGRRSRPGQMREDGYDVGGGRYGGGSRSSGGSSNSGSGGGGGGYTPPPSPPPSAPPPPAPRVEVHRDPQQRSRERP